MKQSGATACLESTIITFILIFIVSVNYTIIFKMDWKMFTFSLGSFRF